MNASLEKFLLREMDLRAQECERDRTAIQELRLRMRSAELRGQRDSSRLDVQSERLEKCARLINKLILAMIYVVSALTAVRGGDLWDIIKPLFGS